ncbi:MAG: hypothetical protein E6I75_05790 [Chloroflexi bacterium]|nr:MAG: hypothetical protein E6I75_05790 [Chloroflexota bacterium]
MGTPTTDEAHVLNTCLDSMHIGEPQVIDALTVVPLHSNSPSPEFNYLTLPEAHATGQVVVSEKPSATVPTLLVINRAGLPILILDGEEIVGGRQNRVVNTTLLVPAHSTFELDVTCVEHGRWHSGLDETLSPPAGRRRHACHTGGADRVAWLGRSGNPLHRWNARHALRIHRGGRPRLG